MAAVLITGASSGFGFEAALAFARKGDRVYASMRDESRSARLLAAAAEQGLEIRIKTLDITRPATFEPLINEVIDESGRLDVLVNNAGILRSGALEDLSEATFRLVMETNFLGPMLLTKAVLPHMRAQGGGNIIMISSLSGVAGLPGDVAYAASKFAMEGATEALRHEVDRWGIRVALVEAGLHATGIFDNSLSEESVLPADYPADSPYRALIETRLRGIRERLPEAFNPARVGELLVGIAGSDGSQLRWPADEVAERVLGELFSHDDAGRDKFLRAVSDSDWWSAGRNAP